MQVITAVVAKGHRPGYLEEEESMYPAGLVRLADVCWTQDPSVSNSRAIGNHC